MLLSDTPSVWLESLMEASEVCQEGVRHSDALCNRCEVLQRQKKLLAVTVCHSLLRSGLWLRQIELREAIDVVLRYPLKSESGSFNLCSDLRSCSAVRDQL